MSGGSALIALAAAAPLAVGGPAAAAPACSIYAGGRTAIITGVAPGSAARLCMITSEGRICPTLKADPSGVIVTTTAAPLDGPIWVEPASSNGSATPPPCATVVPTPTNDSKSLIITLLSALAALLTGIAVALIPRALERRQRSGEAAAAWVGEYLSRLGDFAKSGDSDAEPRPLPALTSRDAKRLSAIATLAHDTLGTAGYLGATVAADRRRLTAPIVAALRAYPFKPPIETRIDGPGRV